MKNKTRMATKRGITRSLRAPRIAFPNRKAITPIIAVIMLLMMAISTASGLFYWLSRVQNQQQGTVESFQSSLFESLIASVDVMSAKYNDQSQNLSIVFQNTGNIKIPLTNGSVKPTTEWAVFDADQKAICATDWSAQGTTIKCMAGCGTSTQLEVGQIRTVTLNLTGTDCGIQGITNNTVLSFTIYFSGKATTTGSFLKA